MSDSRSAIFLSSGVPDLRSIGSIVRLIQSQSSCFAANLSRFNAYFEVLRLELQRPSVVCSI